MPEQNISNMVAETEELLKNIDEQFKTLSNEENLKKYLQIFARHRYSTYNTMAVYLQEPNATQVATQKAWEKRGRSVIDGKGINILKPIMEERQVKQPKLNAETKQTMIDEAGKPIMETVTKQVLTGYELMTVYDVAQTEGRAVNEQKHNLNTIYEALYGKKTEGNNTEQEVQRALNNYVQGLKYQNDLPASSNEFMQQCTYFVLCEYCGLDTSNISFHNSLSSIINFENSGEIKRLLDSVNKDCKEFINSITEKCSKIERNKADEKNTRENIPAQGKEGISAVEKDKTGFEKQKTEQKFINTANSKSSDKQTQNSAKAKYSNKQVDVLRKFIRAGFDINDVKNPEFSEKQLNELYLGKKAGIDISLYCLPKVSAEVMKEFRKTASAGIDLKEIALTVMRTGEYNRDQTLQILDAAKHGVNFKNMLDPDLDHLQMRQIKLGERYGIDTNVYASPDFTAEQMKALRVELIVRKVLETIKEFFKEIWDKFLKLTQTESSNKLNQEVEQNADETAPSKQPKGAADFSAFSVLLGKVYGKVSEEIDQAEKGIVNEAVLDLRSTAEEAAKDIEKYYKSVYQHGYDGYEDMKRQGGVNTDENARTVVIEDELEPEM